MKRHIPCFKDVLVSIFTAEFTAEFYATELLSWTKSGKYRNE